MKHCPSCKGTYEDSLGFCPKDGEVLREPPESLVGRVLDGKYRVEGFIAQGGMGSVYLARHILLGDRVVIKTLRPEMRTNAEWLKRFQREGQAARAFRHPNSVTVYDLSAAEDGLVYLVMEYAEGRTLDRELKARGRFKPAEAVAVLEPVAAALDAAHARGVVHRDLKPENVMLCEGGSVKVLDLGIAKMLGAEDSGQTAVTSLTMTGQILGTPYYMSPEQWGEPPRDGDPEVDGRADVYSLGVIFFELVAGRKPLGGRTLGELRQGHVSAPLPLLHELEPEVPKDFGLVVARAMAKDRGDRQRTAGELIEELRDALAGPDARRATVVNPPALGTQAETPARERPSREQTTPEPPTVEWPRGRRNVAPLLAGGALALLLIAGVGGWMMWRRASKTVEKPAETKTEAPPPEAPRMVTAGSFWIEVFEKTGDAEGKRVAQTEPTLASGQRFRFHFIPEARGYLYIVGPGEGNAQMTILTAQGGGRLKSNLAVAGGDFVYPFGGDRLRLDDNPGAEDYTFIFSPAPLDAPKFLNEKFLHVLTPDEVKELEQFRASHAAVATFLEPKPDTPARVVDITVPQPSMDAGAPFVYDVRINHK
ncbi:MAG TPA: serine/threonine-protein kinase [Pyrinomonadaceae bacterium]|jgi:serine/threonine-protein kinase|nr:serine/threonine-protein kinase [Pyrinomonadaceae bacterium]